VPEEIREVLGRRAVLSWRGIRREVEVVGAKRSSVSGWWIEVIREGEPGVFAYRWDEVELEV
jgi:hypothetical protein